MIKSVCVFCSSNLGIEQNFINVACQLGKKLAQNNIHLIYGGANVGLMKQTAEAVIKNGGKATGVITNFLASKHLTQQGLHQLIVVETMQQRKAKMAELADAFIVLPGGFGTLEELFEVLTASQLGFHKKPVAILNLNGFYTFLQQQLNYMVEHKMLLAPHAKMAHFCQSIDNAFEYINNYNAPVVEKWIENIINENAAE